MSNTAGKVIALDRAESNMYRAKVKEFIHYAGSLKLDKWEL